MTETWHIEMRVISSGCDGATHEPYTVVVEREIPDYLLPTLLAGKFTPIMRGRKCSFGYGPYVDFVERRIVMNLESWGPV